MARGDEDTSIPAMEMTNWFNTDYHYIATEIGEDFQPQLQPTKILQETQEALAACVSAFATASLFCEWIQMAEPIFVMNLAGNLLRHRRSCNATVADCIPMSRMVIGRVSGKIAARNGSLRKDCQQQKYLENDFSVALNTLPKIHEELGPRMDDGRFELFAAP